MNKAPLLAVIVILATASSAGCLDIEWIKDNLIPVPEPVVDYVNIYANVSHTYSTEYDNVDTLVYNQVADVDVPAGSQWMDILVSTSFEDLPDDLPVDLEDLMDRLDIERELTVTLFTPDNKIYKTETYVASTYLPVQWDTIATPDNGTWHVKVESEGVGNEALVQDSFHVQVLVRAPAS